MRKQQELLRSGEPGDIEARMRRHDGVFPWFLIRFEPFRDETGKIVMWYGVSTDVETLKQTEEKLREDERELRQITDAIPQAGSCPGPLRRGDLCQPSCPRLYGPYC
jgi:PAS domain-containing protein